jgi:excisionase family DNA binding protein
MTMNDKLLYRVPEAAERLNLSRAKVYELIRDGVLKSVQIDSSRRVKAEDLRAYVEALGVAA